MKMQKVIIAASLVAAFAMSACTNIDEVAKDACQFRYDCNVKNCKAGDNNCKVALENEYNNCLEDVDISSEARKHVSNKCADAMEEQIACYSDSVRCRAEETSIGGEVVTVYNLIYFTECNYLAEFVEEKCTPEKENVIYLEKDDDNN